MVRIRWWGGEIKFGKKNHFPNWGSGNRGLKAGINAGIKAGLIQVQYRFKGRFNADQRQVVTRLQRVQPVFYLYYTCILPVLNLY